MKTSAFDSMRVTLVIFRVLSIPMNLHSSQSLFESTESFFERRTREDVWGGGVEKAEEVHKRALDRKSSSHSLVLPFTLWFALFASFLAARERAFVLVCRRYERKDERNVGKCTIPNADWPTN